MTVEIDGRHVGVGRLRQRPHPGHGVTVRARRPVLRLGGGPRVGVGAAVVRRDDDRPGGDDRAGRTSASADHGVRARRHDRRAARPAGRRDGRRSSDLLVENDGQREALARIEALWALVRPDVDDGAAGAARRVRHRHRPRPPVRRAAPAGRRRQGAQEPADADRRLRGAERGSAPVRRRRAAARRASAAPPPGEPQHGRASPTSAEPSSTAHRRGDEPASSIAPSHEIGDGPFGHVADVGLEHRADRRRTSAGQPVVASARSPNRAELPA